MQPFDLQLNGYKGIDFNADDLSAASLRQACEAVRADGGGRMLATVIVAVATPNHWHVLAAIWAMQAGKDVYVEKPVSHSIEEGRRMVQVARRHTRICQVGTQARSLACLHEAKKFLADGGTLFPKVALVTEICGLEKATPIDGTSLGIVLHGAEGTLHLKPQATEAVVRDPAGAVVRTIIAPARALVADHAANQVVDHVADHFGNFIAAVRSRDAATLAADIDQGRQSTALCHLGNMSYRLGSDLSFADVQAALATRPFADDPATLVNRMRGTLEANGCMPATNMIRCGTWVETVPAAGRGTEEVGVARDPRAAALERLVYRDPFRLPSENA